MEARCSERAMKRVAGGMKTLYECLLDYDATLLRAIAERRGVELTTGDHDERVQEMAAALLAPDSVAEALAWLNEQERWAVDALLANGGRMRAHRFVRRFGEIRRFGPGSMAREAPWRVPANAAEGLWYRGLIARTFAEQEGTVLEFVFVPVDLLPLLPPPLSDRAAFTVPQADEPHSVILGDPALIDDLCTLLALAQRGDLHLRRERLYPDGERVPEAIDRFLDRFLNKDESRITFAFHLAQTAGFVGAEGRTYRLNRDATRYWLRETRAQQLWALQDAWLEDATWNDLWHVPGIRCEETGWRNDPLLPRKTVLDLLSRGEVDAWLSIPGFVDAVRDQFPDYARPDGDFESWYIRDVRTGEYLTGFEHWDQVEGSLLVYMISGPLHWLGMVSLGYKEGWEKPSVFRMTPWGAAFLHLPHAPLQDLPPQPALVAPDNTVTLAREMPLSDRFQLERIADWRASGSEYVYALTPASLGRALGAGIKVEQIERFLQRISADSVPAAAAIRLKHWADRYGQVRLRRVAILETRTPQVMSELRAHERIRGYLRQVLSPTTTLVRESDWTLLTQELYRAGYLPEIIEH
jgi:hypothetical protein